MDNEAKAKKAAKKIIADLSDRDGLGNEWDNIDEETQREILATWTYIIREAMK
jgi:hypothetical protein